MNKLNNKSGFTLIEIIVVLIIVGILAAIALPNLFSNINKSRSEEALATIGTMRSNVEACIGGHQGNETLCTLAYVGVVTTSANFSYTMAATTASSTGYQITAKGAGALAATDTIIITRATATAPNVGTVTCIGGGTLTGAC